MAVQHGCAHRWLLALWLGGIAGHTSGHTLGHTSGHTLGRAVGHKVVVQSPWSDLPDQHVKAMHVEAVL